MKKLKDYLAIKAGRLKIILKWILKTVFEVAVVFI